MNSLKIFYKTIALASVFAVVLSVLPSCSDTPDMGDNAKPEMSDLPIELVTHLASATETSFGDDFTPGSRGQFDWVGEYTNQGANALRNFTCFAYYGNTGRTLMNGSGVTRDPNTNQCTWTNKIEYWPRTGVPLHFYAFAPSTYKVGDPYANSEATLTDWNIVVENERPVMKNFEVNNPPTADIIYAQARDQYSTTNNGKVSLQFYHALSAIELYIQNFSPYYEIGLHGIDFLHMQYKADFHFPTNGSTSDNNLGWWDNYSSDRKKLNTTSLDNDRWKDHSYGSVVRGHQVAPANTSNSNNPPIVKILTGTKALFVLPQSLAKWKNGDACSNTDTNPDNLRKGKPCIILMGRVTDIRSNTDIIDDYREDRNQIVIPLNPNNDDTPFVLEPNKKYKFVIRIGKDGDRFGWLKDGTYSMIPIHLGFTVEEWKYNETNIYETN